MWDIPQDYESQQSTLESTEILSFVHLVPVIVNSKLPHLALDYKDLGETLHLNSVFMFVFIHD